MGSRTHPTKRPYCPRCSKPARVCLCSRLKFPPLPNNVHVTILQHSLEKNHPLNSTRVAALGLKNLRVVPVTDVNFRAHFTIVPNPDPKLNLSANGIDVSAACVGDVAETRKSLDLPAARGGICDGLAWKSGFLTAGDSKVEFGNEKGMNLEAGFVSEKSGMRKSLDFSTAHLGISDGFALKSGFSSAGDSKVESGNEETVNFENDFVSKNSEMRKSSDFSADHLRISDCFPSKSGCSTACDNFLMGHCADDVPEEFGNEKGLILEKTSVSKKSEMRKNLDFSSDNDSKGEYGHEKGVILESGFAPDKSELGNNLDFSATLLGFYDDLAKRSYANDAAEESGNREQAKSRRITMDLQTEPDNGECTNGHLSPHFKNHGKLNIERKSHCISVELDSDHTEDDKTAIFDKYRVACASTDLQIIVERAANPDIGWVLDTPIGRAAASRGFTVKRMQRKQLHASEEFHDFVEFELAMPAGAALLFPSGKSAISLDAVDFEVKHLVVLDGTWKKARRIYSENPWLQLLPHLKLVPGKESLYSEVRHQPKAGCLSTIESIVCALKGLGNDMEGLDELLDVFEAMVGDQRRLKAENLRATSMS